MTVFEKLLASQDYAIKELKWKYSNAETAIERRIIQSHLSNIRRLRFLFHTIHTLLNKNP